MTGDSFDHLVVASSQIQFDRRVFPQAVRFVVARFLMFHLFLGRAHFLRDHAIAYGSALGILNHSSLFSLIPVQMRLDAVCHRDPKRLVSLALREIETFIRKMLPPHFKHIANALPRADTKLIDQTCTFWGPRFEFGPDVIWPRLPAIALSPRATTWPRANLKPLMDFRASLQGLAFQSFRSQWRKAKWPRISWTAPTKPFAVFAALVASPAAAEGFILSMRADGQLETKTPQSDFAQNYIDGVGAIPPKLIVLAPAESEAPRAAPRPSPAIPRPEILAALQSTAQRYGTHAALRHAGLSVSDWQTLSGPRKILFLDDGTKILPLICYEAAFMLIGSDLASYPDVIIILAAESGFAEGLAASIMRRHARARELETGIRVDRVSDAATY